MEPLSLSLDLKKREKLVKEFKKLKTIQDKINFWTNTLERNYFLYPYYLLDDISDFVIKTNVHKEIEELNNYLVEYGSLFLTKYKKGLTPDFFIKLNEAENKESFIKHELTLIQKVLDKHSHNENSNYNSASSFYKSGYENYYLKSVEPDLSKKIYETNNVIALVEGYKLAKYQKELEDQLKKCQVAKSIKSSSVNLNIKQIIWALEYLGIFKHLKETDTHNAEFLKYILNVHPQTIRKQLSRTKKDKLPNSFTEKKVSKEELNILYQELSKVASKAVLEKIKLDIKNLG